MADEMVREYWWSIVFHSVGTCHCSSAGRYGFLSGALCLFLRRRTNIKGTCVPLGILI